MEDNNGASGGLNPAHILALSTGYWDSQTLLTANRLGLFASLANEALTLEQVSSALGTTIDRTSASVRDRYFHVTRRSLNHCV